MTIRQVRRDIHGTAIRCFRLLELIAAVIEAAKSEMNAVIVWLRLDRFSISRNRLFRPIRALICQGKQPPAQRRRQSHTNNWKYFTITGARQVQQGRFILESSLGYRAKSSTGAIPRVLFPSGSKDPGNRPKLHRLFQKKCALGAELELLSLLRSLVIEIGIPRR